MNTAQAYAILDASNYVQFTGEEGVIRLNGLFNVERPHRRAAGPHDQQGTVAVYSLRQENIRFDLFQLR